MIKNKETSNNFRRTDKIKLENRLRWSDHVYRRPIWAIVKRDVSKQPLKDKGKEDQKTKLETIMNNLKIGT